ncbi:MAG: cytidine deaminase [Bacteroidales bacterium]
MQKQISISYDEFSSLEELSSKDRELLEKATQSAQNAYAPYSKFCVGAALRLSNGLIILGNNQENAAFPSGLCAERVAVFSAGANYPNMPIETLAITAHSTLTPVDHPIAPCGACRQSLIEYEHKYKQKIRIILRGHTGKIAIFDGIESLLPFQFGSDELGL